MGLCLILWFRDGLVGNQVNAIGRCQPVIVLNSGDVCTVHFFTAGLSGGCPIVI